MKNSFFIYKENNMKKDVSWPHSGGTVTVSGITDPIAMLSNDNKYVVIEDWDKKNLVVYEINGNKIGTISIESDAFDYKGLNKCSSARFGISVIALSKNKLFDNPYDDLLQLEVDITNLKIGDKVAIYR